MDKKSSLIIIIVLVLIILGLGGYIIYDKVSDDNTLSENNNSLNNEEVLGENDNSLNRERPYLDGQIKKYFYDKGCGGEQEVTYNFELATDKINGFYIGGTIFEYADMMVQDGKINVTTYLFKKGNDIDLGKDSNYISRNHTIEIKGEKITKIASIEGSSGLIATFLFVLTESGNVYASVYDNWTEEVISFDKISNLKKLDVINAYELIFEYSNSTCSGEWINIYAHEATSGNFIEIYNLAYMQVYGK